MHGFGEAVQPQDERCAGFAGGEGVEVRPGAMVIFDGIDNVERDTSAMLSSRRPPLQPPQSPRAPAR
jgi:hypothetical protein